MNFTRSRCRMLAEEIEKELKQISFRYNLQIKTGNGNFSSNTFTLKLEINNIDDNGTALTKEREAFEFWKRIKAIPDCLDKNFVYSCDTFKVVGYNEKGKKYPIMAIRIRDGKAFKFTVNTIKKAFPDKPKRTPKE